MKAWVVLASATAKVEMGYLSDLTPEELSAIAYVLRSVALGRDIRSELMRFQAGRPAGLSGERQRNAALLYRLLTDAGEPKAAEKACAAYAYGNRQSITKLARAHREYCDAVIDAASSEHKKNLIKELQPRRRGSQTS